MAFTQYTGSTNYISTLDDLPNDVGGLTAAQLKAKFDQYGAEFVTWFNSTHKNELDADVTNLNNHIADKENPHDVTAAQAGAVPTSRTINGHDLTENRSLTAADVGAASATQEGWIAPTLLNGWMNYGSGLAPAGYFKDTLGIVHFRGLIKSGTATTNTLLFYLDVGCRPEYSEGFTVYSNDGSVIGNAQVTSSGSVLFISGGNGVFSLSGITFRAA